MIDKEKIDFWWEQCKKFMGALFNRVDGVDEWKEIWYKSKERFFPYVSEDGRIEMKVTPKAVDYTPDDLFPHYDNLIYLGNKLISEANKFSPEIYSPGRVVEFLYDTTNQFTVEERMQNRILTTDTAIDGKKVPLGTKLSKYVGMVLSNNAKHVLGLKWSPENEAKLKELTDILWSMFVNTLKSSGNVGISINPMDYLLVSSHTTGWRSCHNIINGEYRTGGISYMLDKVSFVGYAYDKKDTIRHDSFVSEEKFPVKQWRAMVFIDDEVRTGVISRQYPGVKTLFQNTTETLIENLMREMTGSQDKIYKVSGRSYSRASYNYTDYVTSVLSFDDMNKTVTIGSYSIPCVRCGDMRKEQNTYTLECDSCRGEKYYCRCCDERCSDEYEFDGSYYCEDCFNEVVVTCDKCGDYCYRDSAAYVDGDWFCEYCANDYLVCCDYCGEYVYEEDACRAEDIGEYFCQSCADRRLHQCDHCGRYFSRRLTEVDDEYFCEDCLPERFECCDECGAYVDDVTEVDGCYYCHDCLDELFEKCPHCGEYINKGEVCECTPVEEETEVLV